MVIVISILFCVTFVTTTVFADSIGLSGGGIRPPTQEEIAYAEANPKVIDLEQLEADRLALLNSRTSYTSVPLTYYAQQYEMSCGPACVRMVLKTLTGSAPSESAVRSGTNYSSSTGTTIASLTSYINNYQDTYTFATSYPSSKSQMCDSIFYGLHYQETPQIIGVFSSTTYGIESNTGGRHAVCSFKISNDYETAYIADPWAGYGGGCDQTYPVTTSRLFNAYNSADSGMSW